MFESQRVVDEAAFTGRNVAKRVLGRCGIVDRFEGNCVFALAQPCGGKCNRALSVRGLRDEGAFPIARCVVEFRRKREQTGVAAYFDAEAGEAGGLVEHRQLQDVAAQSLLGEREMDAERVKARTSEAVGIARLEAQPVGGGAFADRVIDVGSGLGIVDAEAVVKLSGGIVEVADLPHGMLLRLRAGERRQ